jgi:hypothetical protein
MGGVIMAKKKTEGYIIEVVGKAEGPHSAAKPASIEPLIEKSREKNFTKLMYGVLEKQVDMYLTKGDTEGALQCISDFRNKLEHTETYDAPLNAFQRDHQNGGGLFIGAHCPFGSFRDTATNLAWEHFYQKGKTGYTNPHTHPSPTHLRRVVKVVPNHIFFYRPDLNGKLITAPDIEKDGQQPIGAVKGFQQYEVLNPPFQFKFSIGVFPKGKYFSKLLADRDTVMEIVRQMPLAGLGARRSAGHGYWSFVSCEIKDTPLAL